MSPDDHHVQVGDEEGDDTENSDKNTSKVVTTNEEDNENDGNETPPLNVETIRGQPTPCILASSSFCSSSFSGKPTKLAAVTISATASNAKTNATFSGTGIDMDTTSGLRGGSSSGDGNPSENPPLASSVAAAPNAAGAPHGSGRSSAASAVADCPVGGSLLDMGHDTPPQVKEETREDSNAFELSVVAHGADKKVEVSGRGGGSSDSGGGGGEAGVDTGGGPGGGGGGGRREKEEGEDGESGLGMGVLLNRARREAKELQAASLSRINNRSIGDTARGNSSGGDCRGGVRDGDGEDPAGEGNGGVVVSGGSKPAGGQCLTPPLPPTGSGTWKASLLPGFGGGVAANAAGGGGVERGGGGGGENLASGKPDTVAVGSLCSGNDRGACGVENDTTTMTAGGGACGVV